ncbi:alpha/beta hydrolase fold domain-containing protein [Rhodocytophaga rosea]|uniref:Alpha/beta hydrolase fold domain-containing protein n=1 Tax=Rhodocytophaga rosea TaxID=2704465 RepID=A0A6C0GCQ3_9BACT|nr:GDSL-type esterase/lipase family protein [Rhodocytophaga rosea]QHT65460.1 alpha/beta hydrolase fold domain-containing protein [Rhodocytophaga rosea]
MRPLILLCLLLNWVLTDIQAQQKVIPLYPGKAPGSESWTWQEKELFHQPYQSKLVYNVSQPTLTAYLPPAATANGTAVIVAPGGAFHILSIESEGIQVAKWLNSKGVAAFVLKYRLVRSLTDDPVAELAPKMRDFKKLDEINAPVVELAIADGLKAIEYVRSHADDYGVNPKRIGIMGFSAGGTVTMGTVFNSTSANRPNFAAPIYAYMNALKNQTIPADAPPLFICASTDDQLGMASHSTNLYNAWIGAKKIAELHMYEKGGHGFGMRKQDLPVDSWIDRFGEWLELQGLLWPEKPSGTTSQVTLKQVMERRKAAEERVRNDWAYFKKYETENKALTAVAAGEKRVVFMGNSITEGWKRADSSFFAGRPYLDRGISGQTTPQMLLRFRPDVIDLKPAVVVILAGINDIAQNTGPMTLEQTFGNIVSMAELAKVNHIKVVLSSVLPAYDFPWRPGLEPAEKVVKLNNMIKDYATRNNIVYLDYFSAMVDNQKGLKKELTYDGVHPTLAGYKVMEPLAEKAIAEALKRK